MIDLFVDLSVDAAEARRLARNLISRYGAERCLFQLEHFDRRCEQAEQTERGLENPVGLYIHSVRHNWSPPSAGPSRKEKEPKRWYTDEEAKLFLR